MLVEGQETAEGVAQRTQAWEGISLGAEAAQQTADIQNDAHRKVAGIMIGLTSRHMELSVSISRVGLLLQLDGFAELLPKTSFRFATWKQAALRISGGRLAVCSAVHLDGLNQEEGEGTLHSIAVDDGLAEQTITASTENGTLFSVGIRVEASEEGGGALKDLASITGNYAAAAELLAGNAESDFEIAEQIHSFVTEERARGAAWVNLPSASRLISSTYRHAQALRQVRRKSTAKVGKESLPEPWVLADLSRDLGVRRP
jgi:hypothetical protein